MITDDLIEVISIFPAEAIVLVEASDEMFPIFDLSTSNKVGHLESGWAPLSSLPFYEVERALTVSKLMDKIMSCNNIDYIICKVQSEDFEINKVAPLYHLRDYPGVVCVINTSLKVD